ncbi:MAG: DUF5063 domain-containing protein [Bacteroidales bacterium]|nr:DUF5063 domain-containing protein [Bacteroidales bacterium]
MEYTYPEEPVFSKNVIEMLTVANEYCLFLSEVEKYETEYVFDYLRKIFPLIYLKASLLPDIEPTDPDSDERYITDEEWQTIFNSLNTKFARHNDFCIVDPFQLADPAIENQNLAACCTDVFRDLMDFIRQYQKSSILSKENAVHALRHQMVIRMGYRLLYAFNALHFIAFGPEDGDIYSGLG